MPALRLELWYTLPMKNYEKELQTALSIAREAGVVMLKYFDEDQHVK